MASVSPEKIFVDPKEEITFVLERILSADKERVIMVVPQNSILFSSLISLSILQRRLLRTKKTLIIVSEDEYGLKISEKLGIITSTKVSLITGAMWDDAISRKKEDKEKLDEHKSQLLSNITNEEKYEEEVPSPKSQVPNQEEESGELEEKPQEIPITPVAQIEEEILKDEALNEIKEDEDIRSAIDNEAPYLLDTKEDEEEKALKKYQKPRREVKIVNLEGIEVISGGDIKDFIKDDESDIMQDVNNKAMENSEIGNRKIKSVNTSGGNFTGRDFTKAVSDESKISAFFKNLFKPRRLADPLEQSKEDKNRRRIIIAFFVGFILLLATGLYLLAFKFSSVDIILKLKKEDISTSANILADPSITALTTDPSLAMPARSIKVENLTLSKTGEANGEGKAGQKASGRVTIWNLRLKQPVSLPAGTVITSTDTSLKYKLTADVTIDAVTTASNNTTEAKKVEDVAVQAFDVGAEYNVTGSSSNSDFAVTGYDHADVYASRYYDFTGGNSNPIVTVSKDNIAKLKETMLPDLKKQADSRLAQLVGPEEKLVAGTMVYDDSAAPDSFPKEGEEAKDKTFSLTLKLSATALVVKKSDLSLAVEQIIRNTRGTSEPDIIVDNVNEPVINSVQPSSDGKYVLTLSTQGSLKQKVTADDIKKAVVNYSIPQLKEYLSSLESVESYNIFFNPDIVPEGFRRVPADTSKINVKVN